MEYAEIMIMAPLALIAAATLVAATITVIDLLINK